MKQTVAHFDFTLTAADWSLLVLAAFAIVLPVDAQNTRSMPRENVVDVPAVGDGLCVSNVFQSNMVLQRDKPIAIWGWATAGDEVTVRFAGHKETATAADDRSWRMTLPAVSVNNDAQTLDVETADARLSLQNILVGDVWIVGGQSNMEFPLDRVENGQLEIISANHSEIRILTVPAANGPNKKPDFARLHEWSNWFKRHYRKGDWDVCRPEIARELSAIGYVFARRVHSASQIPIGIVDVSRGGTAVETWTPEPVLREIDSPSVAALLSDWDDKVAQWNAEADLESRIKNFRQKAARLKAEGKSLPANETEPSDLRPGPTMDHNHPGNCYASMIAPLEGLHVKGAIFHQGYNNCFNGTEGAIVYREIFPKMIASWRAAFDDPAMPFGILSLCTDGPMQTLETYSEMMANAGPYVREAQYNTFLNLFRSGDKNVGFVSTYDLNRRWYHPQLKVPAGERIARWALSTQYGFERDVRWKPPIVTDSAVEDDRLVLRLDEPAMAVDTGGPIIGFAVAGENRQFHPATATHLVTGKDDRGRDRLDKRAIVLTSPMVPTPIHYRYAWARNPLGNLQAASHTDIPFATQRSDDWPMEAIPLGVFGEDTPKTLDRAQRRAVQQALQKLDLDRRLESARALLESQSDE